MSKVLRYLDEYDEDKKNNLINYLTSKFNT
jgi:hypothetical protein